MQLLKNWFLLLFFGIFIFSNCHAMSAAIKNDPTFHYTYYASDELFSSPEDAFLGLKDYYKAIGTENQIYTAYNLHASPESSTYNGRSSNYWWDFSLIYPNSPSSNYTGTTGSISINIECLQDAGSSGNLWQLKTLNTGLNENLVWCEKIIDVPLFIEINGASSTQALPSLVGPINQTIKVSAENIIAANIPVLISISDDEGNTSSTVVVTNEQGVYDFIFIPPFLKSAVVTLSASCADCGNIANKTIKVISPGFIDPPQICHR